MIFEEASDYARRKGSSEIGSRTAWRALRFRSWEFDAALVALFDDEFRVWRAVRLPIETFQAAEARTAVFDYIETLYNPVRLHSTLDYLPPNDYEQMREEEQQAA